MIEHFSERGGFPGPASLLSSSIAVDEDFNQPAHGERDSVGTLASFSSAALLIL